MPHFKTAKRVCIVLRRVQGLSASVLAAGDEKVSRLAGVLQQPQCRTLSGIPVGHAKVLHGVGNLKSSVAGENLSEISPAGYAETKRRPGVVHPRGGGLQNAEMSSCHGAEPGLLSKA